MCCIYSILVSGCAQRITLQEYHEKCEKTYQVQNSVTGGVYYCGSKNGFDYVYFRVFLGLDDLAKLDSGLLHVIEMPYTPKESD